MKLLDRTTRRVSVTPDGAAYYERCVAILAQVRESGGTAHPAPLDSAGRLRVDARRLSLDR